LLIKTTRVLKATTETMELVRVLNSLCANSLNKLLTLLVEQVSQFITSYQDLVRKADLKLLESVIFDFHHVRHPIVSPYPFPTSWFR